MYASLQKPIKDYSSSKLAERLLAVIQTHNEIVQNPHPGNVDAFHNSVRRFTLEELDTIRELAERSIESAKKEEKRWLDWEVKVNHLISDRLGDSDAPTGNYYTDDEAIQFFEDNQSPTEFVNHLFQTHPQLKQSEQRYFVAFPDEDGHFHLVQDGINLTWGAALHHAETTSELPIHQGTAYVIFNEETKMAVAIYLNGYSWERKENPIEGYKSLRLMPREYDEDYEDDEELYGTHNMNTANDAWAESQPDYDGKNFANKQFPAIITKDQTAEMTGGIPVFKGTKGFAYDDGAESWTFIVPQGEAAPITAFEFSIAADNFKILEDKEKPAHTQEEAHE